MSSPFPAPLTSRKAAEILGVSQKTVGLYVRRGWLIATRVGRQYYIDPDSLHTLVKNGPKAKNLEVKP